MCTALLRAAKLFRALKVVSLTREELINNKPDPLLATKSERAALGDVHAFMSHSWNDDGAVKYDRLQEYAKSKGGATECRIWLDKACLDQTDIDGSLSVLPIYLSGCQELLVLAGPSYPSRLWCVMEIFVFVQMGGQRDSMAVRPLDDAASLGHSFAIFDAAEAQTYHDADREKLLAIIEAAFGTCIPFNQVVRSIFQTHFIYGKGLFEGKSLSSQIARSISRWSVRAKSSNDAAFDKTSSVSV